MKKLFYGQLETLGPFSGLVFSENTTLTSRTSYNVDLVMQNNITLTIKNICNILGRCTVYVENGGHLIIDGGVLTNAKINLQSGGKISIINGGKIVMRTNTDFSAPVGAFIEIQNGEIIRSNDF